MTLITTKLKSGGLHEKHVVALGKLGTTSAKRIRTTTKETKWIKKAKKKRRKWKGKKERYKKTHRN
jgi:hypothetical protein